MPEQEVSIEKIFGSHCEYIPESVATLEGLGYRVIGNFNINVQNEIDWALIGISQNAAVGVVIADSFLSSEKIKGIYYLMQKPHKDLIKE